MPNPANATMPHWSALLRACQLAGLEKGSSGNYMWMCENPAGVHQYKHRGTRNYAFLRDDSTLEECREQLAVAECDNCTWTSRCAAHPPVKSILTCTCCGGLRTFKNQTIRTLYCACCGGSTRGRQWWNQDIGFGLCGECVIRIRQHRPFGGEPMTPEEFTRTYGHEGVHFNVEEAAQ